MGQLLRSQNPSAIPFLKCSDTNLSVFLTQGAVPIGLLRIKTGSKVSSLQEYRPSRKHQNLLHGGGGFSYVTVLQKYVD